MPYGDWDLCHYWLRKWLVAWHHQAITWTNSDFSLVRLSDIHLRASSLEIPQSSTNKMIWKIKYLKYHSNVPRVNELTHWGRDKKIATTSQRTFSIAFSWMKMHDFRSRFHLSFSQLPILALAQMLAWRRPGDKLSSKPMVVSLPTHICITRPKWVK